jgi:hypothetical protein
MDLMKLFGLLQLYSTSQINLAFPLSLYVTLDLSFLQLSNRSTEQSASTVKHQSLGIELVTHRHLYEINIKLQVPCNSIQA